MASEFQILITDRFDAEAEAQLGGLSQVKIRHSATTTPSKEELSQANGLIIRSRTKIDANLLLQAPNLKIIITCTSGFDHIDLKTIENSDLKVMFTPNANAASACEITWALTLACARKLPSAHRSVKAGEWRREGLVGSQLSGKTYGVIGLGRIGTRVARAAQAFGMNVIAFDPYKDDEHFKSYGAERVSLDEIFMLANVVSVHVPATPDTHHMIKPLILEDSVHGIIFVNTSRGSVIDETLLCTALDRGCFASAGLDVFEREPLPRYSPLATRDNVILTPHIGAATGEAFRAASMEASLKMQEFITSGKVSDPLPPNEIWMSASFRAPSTP